MPRGQKGSLRPCSLGYMRVSLRPATYRHLMEHGRWDESLDDVVRRLIGLGEHTEKREVRHTPPEGNNNAPTT